MPAAPAPAPLSADEYLRYGRHLTLPDVGLEGQQRLKEASVLIVGAGGLGSPVALYLAAAGVGHLGLVDFDAVDASNLQRQILYGTSDVGRQKLEAARDRLRDLNPHVDLTLHDTRLTRDNALDLIGAYDVVADGTDNFATRYLVNDAAVLTGTPNAYASIFRFEGQASVFGMPDGPCYRCAYPEPPPPGLVPSCAEGGVLGVLPGLVGTIQATEVLKLLLGIGDLLAGRLLLLDTLAMTFRTLRLNRDPHCPICGDHPSITELIDYEAFCGTPSTSVFSDPMMPSAVPEMTVREFHERRTGGTAPFLLDVREPNEAAVADIGADQLIPVHELGHRLDEIEAGRDAEIVVHCRSGARSAYAVQMLRAAGYPHAKNLAGGTLAWSREIDSSVPAY